MLGLSFDSITIPTHQYGLHRSILHNEEYYPNPESFMPERFLEPKSTPANFTIPFGFGRRICPGIDVAEQSLFIPFAR